MLLVSMASDLASLNICASIRKSQSRPIVSYANKAKDYSTAHTTRADDGAGTRILRGGIGGLGYQRLGPGMHVSVGPSLIRLVANLV